LVGMTGFEPATPTSRNLLLVVRASSWKLAKYYKNRDSQIFSVRGGSCNFAPSRA
jgi:hypothetical protein